MIKSLDFLGECQIQDPGQAVVADMKLEPDICDTKIQAIQADSIHNQNKVFATGSYWGTWIY